MKAIKGGGGENTTEEVKPKRTRAKKTTDDGSEVKPKKPRAKKKDIDTGGKADEQPIIQEASVQKEAPKKDRITMPLFIGTRDKAMVEKLVKTITGFDNNDFPHDFELVIMSPEVVEKSMETWYFTKLSKNQQEAIIDQQNNEEQRKKALKSAVQADEALRKLFFEENLKLTREEQPKVYTFRHYELKAAYSLIGKEISNAQVREMIDFMSIFNYITPTLIGENYHKQQYEVTLDDTAQLESTRQLEDQVMEKINELNGQLLMLSDNRKILEERLMQVPDNADAVTDNNNESNNNDTGISAGTRDVQPAEEQQPAIQS